jgi:ribonuclease-3
MKDDLQERIKYRFQNEDFLIEALTHSSYANENHLHYDNERLEFLGDAVVGLVINEYLFLGYPTKPEGEMAKAKAYVASEKILSKASYDIGLGDELFLGKGEEKSGGRDRPSILADAFEALCAAIFLDGGWDKAKKFILFSLKKYLNETFKDIHDYKSVVQNYVQKFYGTYPKYKTIEISGPPHNRKFTVALTVNGEVWGVGSGRSKKEAEQVAAKEAYNSDKIKE